MSSNDDKLQFSVDSSLLFQLGEQLVAKPSVALAELVKNAYDADATQVLIIMENIGEPGGTIFIEDNGHGMTFEEIQKGWMRIATNNKQDNPISRKYMRPVTGAKGIGRFAARRLGTRLILQSIAHRQDEQRKEAVAVTFDWSTFTPGVDISSVSVDYRRLAVPNDQRTGVTLIIENARDAWTEEEITDLKRDLLSLQSPFPELVRQASTANDNVDPGFTLEIDIGGSGELETLSGDLGEDFLSLSLAHLEGWVDQDGIAHYRLNMRNDNDLDELTDDMEDYRNLQDVKFQLYYFSERAADFSSSSFRLRDFRNKAKDAAGVRVYLDGFRVFPYGEDGDDWLGLDYYAGQNVDMANQVSMPGAIVEMDRQVRADTKLAGGDPRPYLLIPRNRQVFGAVFLSQSHIRDLEGNTIEIKASREGLVENIAYDKLLQFIQRGIYWLTLKYAASTIKRRAEARKSRTEKRRSVPDIIEEARDEIKSLTSNPSALFRRTGPDGMHAVPVVPGVDEETTEKVIEHLEKEATKQVQDAARSVDEQLEEASEQSRQETEETISYIAMLRLLASAGTSLMLMQHQMRALIDQVNFVKYSLNKLRPQIPHEILTPYDQVTEDVANWYELVNEQVIQLGFMLTPENRQRRRRHALYELVENVRKSMGYYMIKHHIDFTNQIPQELRTPPVYRAEVYAIILNILTNALKAVYGQTERRIVVDAERLDEFLYIRMRNTGKRISPRMKERGFEPFESDSIANPVLGEGTGLGLTVVRDTVLFYDGEVRFIDVEDPWQTGIEIIIPYR